MAFIFYFFYVKCKSDYLKTDIASNMSSILIIFTLNLRFHLLSLLKIYSG